MNNRNDIAALVRQGESESLELKSSFGKEVIETIVAFSNTRGGRIILGCSDKRKITGVILSDESIQHWTNEVKQSTQPAVFPSFETVPVEDKTVVVIHVDEFPLKPVSFKNRYFCRKKNSNHLLSVDEIAEMRFLSLNYSFDAFPVDTSFEELDQTALHVFSKRMNESGRYVPSGHLQTDFAKIGLINKGKLTRAAQLLFGTHHTAIHVGRLKTRDNIIDDMVIRSPLITGVEEVMNFIKRNIMLSYRFTGELKREERWQYPLQALRELLLNAVVHKDYTNPTDVMIKIFDDSIEFSNPGRLLGGLTVEDLQTNSYLPRHRNKLLAEAFYLTGDIEKYGTGFIRLRNWLKDYPELDYQFSDLSNFLQIRVSANKKGTEKGTERGTERGTEKLTENQQLIFDNIRSNPHITSEELAGIVGIRADKIRINIAKLKAKGFLERIGPDKGGYWKAKGSSHKTDEK
jgi:ATP-dependent DNA helicase RecG